jgi:spore coat protein A, manganese oxidase
MNARVSHLGLALPVWAALLVAAGCGDNLRVEADAGAPSTDAGLDGEVERARLDPTTIPKFLDPLVIPPAMPPVGQTGGVTEYAISARQFRQQILPTGLPQTTVWGYGREGDPLPGSGAATTFNYPAFTIEARSNETVRVKWVNGLVDADGNYLPHFLPVDQTLHWANPPGPRDSMGMDPTPYLGPVPLVTHVHGAHVPDISDGYPEAWYLPAAANLPAGYFTEGSHYRTVTPTDTGAALFEYPNSQRAMTIWYHDHALGITRLNVYAGLAGFWIIRDDEEDALGLPGPAPGQGDAAGTRYYEIPIAIQDRSFYADGELAYPTSRVDFDGYEGPYHPETDVPPIWNPEFFGNAIVVNGRTWPALEVEPRLYRLRLLNGCGARFLLLKLDRALPIQQIGNEGGLLPDAPLAREEILLAPAERADVIVDFSSLAEGEEVTLLNLAPDEPYKGPHPEEPLPPADPETTGRVMRFKVVAPTGQGTAGAVPTALPAIALLTTTLPARELTLNEEMSMEGDFPVAAMLGTLEQGSLRWSDVITETPKRGDTEIWRIINLTADAHPIHLHLVHFQVLDRTPFDAEAFAAAQASWLEEHDGAAPVPDDYFTGAARGPEPAERGWKETVIANPGEVTRIIATFDMAGLYVWHCHILEHEDNEMMRPYRVVEP